MPFSVRNSSRSMYCSWKRPPSTGRVLSHKRGPRNADWLNPPPDPPPPPPLPQPLLLLLLTPLLPVRMLQPPFPPPKESSSMSVMVLSLSLTSQQSLRIARSPFIGCCRRDFKLAMELRCPPLMEPPDWLQFPNCGLAPAGRSGVRSWVSCLDIVGRTWLLIRILGRRRSRNDWQIDHRFPSI